VVRAADGLKLGRLDDSSKRTLARMKPPDRSEWQAKKRAQLTTKFGPGAAGNRVRKRPIISNASRLLHLLRHQSPGSARSAVHLPIARNAAPSRKARLPRAGSLRYTQNDGRCRGVP